MEPREGFRGALSRAGVEGAAGVTGRKPGDDSFARDSWGVRSEDVEVEREDRAQERSKNMASAGEGLRWDPRGVRRWTAPRSLLQAEAREGSEAPCGSVP